MMRALSTLCLLALACLWPLGAQAHKPSDSYLTLNLGEETIEGRWEIALRDLEYAIGQDADGDGAITWGELRRRHLDIAAYALARLKLSAEGQACDITVTDQLAARHSDGAYAVLAFQADCPPTAARLQIAYDLFFDLDPQHRGLLQIESSNQAQTAIFSPENRRQVFDLTEPGWATTFLGYLREGAWHIWIGYDHILFLLALLLPAALRRTADLWQPAEGFRSVLFEVAKVVTAFTLAHSLTLSLVVLEWVHLPSRLVESVIAASVVAAALNNLWPIVTRRLWLVAFLFGLIHGFGFASVLSGLALPAGALLAALGGFNLGVELGQLAIVAAFLPLVYGVRRQALYRHALLPAGSTAVAGIAGLWLTERLLNLDLPLV